jgi:hypothetical protein
MDFSSATGLLTIVKLEYHPNIELRTGLRRKVPQDNIPHTHNCQVTATTSYELSRGWCLTIGAGQDSTKDIRTSVVEVDTMFHGYA